MNHLPCDPRRGFTLIELMMALAMGTAIILIATAGVRAASLTMTAVNRLSFQNNLLREGFIAASNEVDFWLRVDDPGFPNRQPLRKPAVSNGGHAPFTPFRQSWPTGKIGTKYYSDNNSTERMTGWNPSVMTWASADPRTWCRVNGAERASSVTFPDPVHGRLTSDLRFGDYSLFEHINPAGRNVSTTMYNAEGCRSWYGNQIKGALDAMGMYGLCAYLPSNTFWAYHGPAPLGALNTDLNLGNMPFAMLESSGWISVKSGPYHQNFMRGRYLASRGASFPLPNPDPEKLKEMPANGYGRSLSSDPHRTYWKVGNAIKDKDTTAMRNLLSSYLECTKFDEDLMAIRPTEWPDIAINVHRYVKNSRMLNLCIIEIFDPTTSTRTSLPFTCFGTTLRGARQQRSPSLANGGWATYNNANPNKVVLSPTLDWQTTRTISQ